MRRAAISDRITVREIVVWTIGAAVEFAALFAVFTYGRVDSDSETYVDVADNIAVGNGFVSDVIAFDVERAHGVVPAPLTTFPPGYSTVIAGFRLLGISGDVAALMTAMLASVLSVVLFGLICRALELDVWVTRVALLLFITNTNTMYYSGSPATEPPFMALVLAGTYLVILGQRTIRLRSARALALVAGVALGCSYWMRYAGLFVTAGFAIALALMLLVRRDRRAIETFVLTLAPAIALVALGFARNIALTGDWRGGNEKIVEKDILRHIIETIQAFSQLILGGGYSPLARIFQTIVILSVVVAAIFWRRRPCDPAVGVIAVATVTYILAVAYAGFVSDISYSRRMFFPVLPLILIVGAACVAVRRHTTLARCVAAAGLIASAVASVIGLLLMDTPASNDIVAGWLEAQTESGESMRTWMDSHVGPDEPLLTSNAAGTHHTVHRPVVALIESTFSDATWDRANVVATMNQFRIRYIVLYVDGSASPPPNVSVVDESPFLTALVRDETTPGFTVAARSAKAIVLERRGP